MGQIIEKTYDRHGNIGTAIFLDHIKELGYHYSTIGATSISMMDIEVPKDKPEILEKAEKKLPSTKKLSEKVLSQMKRDMNVL